MASLHRTDSEHTDFVALVKLLDAELAERDGDDHTFYNQFNSIASLNHAIVAYHDNTPVGCGAIKLFDPYSMEVKRMYVLSDYRGSGIAYEILAELEKWTKELGCSSTILETGKRQPEAIAFYSKHNYKRISNYGQYIGVENSICFKKEL